MPGISKIYPRRLKFSLLWLGLLALALPAHAAKPFRVVLDPGHGGDDEGTAWGHGSKRLSEKRITLAIARRVAAELKKRGLAVILTRTTDRELPLAARTALANKVKADLFISIHMNSKGEGSGNAEGVETYILNTESDASSRRLAHLENSVLSGYQTETPEQTDVALILKDLRLDANLTESKRLACGIQAQLVTATNRIALPVTTSAPPAEAPTEPPPTDAEAGAPSTGSDQLTLSAAAPAPPAKGAAGEIAGEIERRAAADLAAIKAYRLAKLSDHKRKQRNRGVRQALFHVLLGADMPSALVEAGFLTSPRDRALVASVRGQQAMAQAIARAINRFRLDRGTPRAQLQLSRCKGN